ncbi:hypothetical protein L873DRAFT_1799573, partial [Choiromyces venosus 120613-1]
MQDMNSALVSYQRSHSTRQTTLTRFFNPNCVNPELLSKGGNGVQRRGTIVDLEVEHQY